MRANPFSHHSSNELKLEKKDEDNLDQFICHICMNRCDAKHERRRHVDEVHSIATLLCLFCEFKTVYIRNLRSHLDKTHMEFPRIKCEMNVTLIQRSQET